MERELQLRSADEVADAIRRLAIRGAPLIGVAAAYGVVLGDRSPNSGAALAGIALRSIVPQCCMSRAPEVREFFKRSIEFQTSV